MFIAMNRFQVKLGQEAEFERVWRERDILLRDVPGFVEFHLLKGPQREDHTLYSSHTVWVVARTPSRAGPSPRPSARRTRMPARTAVSISAARTSRASKSSRM